MSTNAAAIPRAQRPQGPREIPQHVSPGLWSLAWRRLLNDRVGVFSWRSSWPTCRWCWPSYAGVIAGGNSGAVVVPGDPDNSLIVKRPEGTVPPQMPLGIAPLTAPEIGRIRQWIPEGALNN